MIWIAKLKDGSIIKQHDGIKLDKSQVDTFRISESSGDSTVHFSADSGIIRFSNLNYQKLKELSGGEEVKLIYDKENEVFRLDKESLEFINQIVLRDERAYFYVEFDQTGKFYIEGKPFYMTIKTNKEYEFINNPPYSDFKYTIGAYDDFYMGNGKPIKKMSYNSKFMLGHEKEYEFDIGKFNVKHTIVVDILKGLVLHESYIQSENKVNGSIVTYFADKRESVPVEFNKGSNKYFKKTLTLI